MGRFANIGVHLLVHRSFLPTQAKQGRIFGLLVHVLLPQVDDVLVQLDAVRIHQANNKCPRGFFLVPADKTKWSWTKQADCFSLYTKNVQLFFVCRMFFEELKAAATTSKADASALIAHHSEVQFDHEFSEPIPLELPRVRP